MTKKFTENWFIILMVVVGLVISITFKHCTAENFIPYIAYHSKKNNIPFWLVKNIIQVESSFKKYAVSKATVKMAVLPIASGVHDARRGKIELVVGCTLFIMILNLNRNFILLSS